MKKSVSVCVGLFAFLGSFLGFFSLALAASREAGNTLCFIPGARGGTEYVHQTVPKLLAARGISFLSLRTGEGGTVQDQANKARQLLQKALNQNPSLRCHLLTESSGGITARFMLKQYTLNHPTLGVVPLSRIVASLTFLATPQQGTPLGDIVGRYTFGVDAIEQVGLRWIQIFNSPNYPRTYSPIPRDMPVYSYRTFVNNASETIGERGRVGFERLVSYLGNRGLDTTNDGNVPLASQGGGFVIADLYAPHKYFSMPCWVPVHPEEFFERHGRFLFGQVSLGQLRQGLFARGLAVR